MRMINENTIIMAYEANINTVAWCYRNYDLKTSKVIKETHFYGLPVNKRMNRSKKIKLNKL